MDIRGGAGITRGPRNLLSNLYIASPISITVEGANILTRTLMIFGQGALRAHPFALRELETFEENDLNGFDQALWGHFGHLFRNAFRAVLLSISRGYLAVSIPKGDVGRYYRKIIWSSACFAFMADMAMILSEVASRLKAMGGRFSDIFSWMYLGTAVIRRFETEGQKREDLPLLRWSMDYAFTEIQRAFEGIFRNFETKYIGALFRGPILWLARVNPIGPIGDHQTDKNIMEVSTLAQTQGAQRDRLLDGMYMPKDHFEQLYRLEYAFKLTVSTDPIETKIRRAIKDKMLKKSIPNELYQSTRSWNNFKA